jgi:hypothetical protein
MSHDPTVRVLNAEKGADRAHQRGNNVTGIATRGPGGYPKLGENGELPHPIVGNGNAGGSVVGSGAVPRVYPIKRSGSCDFRPTLGKQGS